MFRVKESEEIQGFSLAQRVVQITIIVALLVSCGSAYLLVQEDRRLAGARDISEPATGAALESLRTVLRFQLVSSVVITAMLAFCLAFIWWLQRRYSAGQQSLRRLKMLAHDILASMDRGVVTTNRDGIITSINPAALQLLEVKFECVGRSLASIAPAGVPLEDIHRGVVEGDSAARDRDFNLDRAGRVLRLRVDAHALEDVTGTGLGCVIHLRDVTERLLLEERMRRMERFLSLASLASGLHHEIKNPLTALGIHLQLLEERLTDARLGQPVEELVGILKTEVYRLNGVLDSFRSFANLQRLRVQPTDALRVLENTARLVAPQAAQYQVKINFVSPDAPLPPVPLDAEKFEQAILNLVINALEAMPGGGCVTLRATVREGWLCVEVIDTGPGIAPEIQKHLFQPYFSGKSTGTGMGLALCEKLIGQHGGHINYHTSDKGTTFCVSVPLKQEHERI
ncbi:MAG TPA: ATP-binding protein [Gemmataceae bacterium]|nr:ATP-binding protein [Gemmataceae bacterium]